jgi:drug/metabolite transporter (DMT)-like permease
MFPLWQIAIGMSFPTLLVVVGAAALVQPQGPRNSPGAGALALVIGSLIWAGVIWLQPWRPEGRWRFEKRRGDEGPSGT